MDAVDLRDDRAFRRLHDAHDAFHERRLAVAVCAQQDNGFSAADLERHVLDHAHRAISSVNPGNREATGQGKPFRLQDRA